MEVIAQCYFFKFPETVSEEFKTFFAAKSVFYGQNWKSIIDEDRHPFPTKKNSSSNSTIESIKSLFLNIWYWLKEHALITSVIGLIGLGYAGYKQIKSDIGNNKSGIESLKESTTKISSTIENLKRNYQLQKGEIIIEKGQKTGQKEINIKTPKREIISILCTNDLIKYTIFSSNNENESRIIFYYETKEKVKNEEKIDFEYSIIRELK